MQGSGYNVTLKELADKLELENCTPDLDIDHVKITQTEVNRPALQLAGYFDYFDSSRIQIIGHVEHTYMQKIGIERSVDVSFIAVRSGSKMRSSNWRTNTMYRF